jgi:hypothetical protein
MQFGDIGTIHREYQIEVAEIRRSDLAGALPGDVYPVISSDRDRAPIRMPAYVPATCAGRIDLKTISKAGLADEMRQDPLGKRRAADVAPANKQDAKAFHLWSMMKRGGTIA